MNLHPTSVHQDTPFQRAYRIFRASGLRHLYVYRIRDSTAAMRKEAELVGLMAKMKIEMNKVGDQKHEHEMMYRSKLEQVTYRAAERDLDSELCCVVCRNFS